MRMKRAMMSRSSLLNSAALLLLLFLAVNDTAEAASAKNRVSATKTSAIRGPKVTVDDAEKYVVTANEALRVQKNAIGLASWAQSSDITPENDQAYIEASQRYDEFSKAQFNEVKAYFDLFPQLSDFTRRQLEKMGIIGTSALTRADASTFSRSSLEMKKVYSTARITAGGRPNLELEPDLTEILANSSDEKLLREVWVNWRDATGPLMRQDYITYYTLGNKAARLNSLPGKDFRTYDDLWMAEWETADMKAQVDKLMEETMPLYQKIHAYVRYHLKEKYGDGVMPADGTIPAHLLGNMWAQQWGNLLTVIPEMNPNPDLEAIDAKVNEKLKTWTVERMFELSEKFFADLGMQKMTDTFWKKSILVKPTDRNLTCHASAWDFYDASKTDFRIKQCTEKTMSDLVTVHHEMGHIQYYMNYVVQPPIYRRGANPGFHEAIGDLIALAVATPQHLVKVDLLDPIPPADVEKINLNYQMKMALDKVAFLPFAYVMDKWRWDVFGEVATTETAMNRRWWEYRLQYQGLSPPITDRKRNERDFDPGAKYHIPAGVEYVRYFASHVLQFQFYERMCKTVAGITEQNLYTCDFDGNKEAGAALMAMLAQGSSRSWPDILESFIGSRTMSLGSLNKYFKPLNDYLDKFIADNKITVGWNAKVEDYVEPMNAADFLAAANEQYRRALNAMTDAEWQQGSDISETNEANLVEAVEDFNAFRQKQFTQTKAFNFSALAPLQRRQFEKFAVIGTSALNEADASTFTNAKLAMETVFSTATIDAGGNSSLTLEPDLTEILATSTDEPLLKEVWTKFRDATGRKMRQNYTTYFTLGNKAATLNTLPGKEFKTFDDLWMFAWEADDLKAQVDTLMNETLPLYQKIHAYVRYHLKEKYGDKVMPADGTIPAHLLGNMWAQSWSNLLNIVPALNPRSDVQPIDAAVDKKLATWTIRQLYELSEKFFHDLGMDNMTPTFWNKSILEKPTDRNMTCHASAWDFFAPTKDDYRIKQCTLLNINQLRTVHHEMGHIQYFMEYARQNPVYREGANPGFHEAIGDLIALAVSTPQHLVKVGLLDPIPAESLAAINLNYQMKMALDKVAFLPFAYVMDKWRWDVFGGQTPTSRMNRRWWELSIEYQGISPPVKRSELDFDPGAKYHIPAGVEYVRYFASHVLQFQFLEQMCKTVAGITEQNLYACDFDGNKEAGAGLITMLRKGSSDTWQSILKDYIGSEKMSLSSLNKYFKPLEAFLDEFIANNTITVGWTAKVDDYISSGGLSASLNFLFLLGSTLVAVFTTFAFSTTVSTSF